jgi:hypothetical protein
VNKAAKISRYLQLFFGGLCFVFVLVVILDTNRDYELTAAGESENQAIEGNQQTAGEAALVSAKPLGDYDQIIERPLFMQDRRPYVAEGLAQTPQKNRRQKPTARIAQDEYILSAVIITSKKRIALLQSQREKKLQKLHQGDELDGWTLTDIQPAWVSLKKGAEIKQLDLTVKGSPPATDTKRKKNNNAVKMTETAPSPPATTIMDKNSPDTQAAPNQENGPEDPAK